MKPIEADTVDTLLKAAEENALKAQRNADNKRLAEMAKEAILVQDACNLSGVIHSFSRVLTELREILVRLDPDKFSTEVLNRHPISVMYSSKIASLTGSENGLAFSHAYGWCKDLKDTL
jgi:hypothetical protein